LPREILTNEEHQEELKKTIQPLYVEDAMNIV